MSQKTLQTIDYQLFDIKTNYINVKKIIIIFTFFAPFFGKKSIPGLTRGYSNIKIDAKIAK